MISIKIVQMYFNFNLGDVRSLLWSPNGLAVMHAGGRGFKSYGGQNLFSTFYSYLEWNVKNGLEN